MAGLPKDHQTLGIHDDIIHHDEHTDHLDKGVVVEEREGAPDKDMSPAIGSSIHRSASRPQLDLSGAAIQGNFEERDPTILLPNQSDDISHLSLDIGGSLIKLVYFSRHEDRLVSDRRKKSIKDKFGVPNGSRRSYPILGGRLHFVKFETHKINECLDFIHSKQLHRGGMNSRWQTEPAESNNAVIKATGGGAHKFSDLFNEKLGVSIEKEDEMNCLVAGANFLLKAIRHEAFTHMEGHKEFVQIDQNELFPYLLVNIGSGVSMIKVDGDGKFERVSGTNVGGGTYWGLGKLLTKCKSFDELLELSQRGDNRTIDMLVGDIYGGLDYSKIGLSASTIASSFGKVITEDKEIEDYKPEDISLSLLRMISYNIGQIAYLNALRFGLNRIFFGGFFIRGHAYTMDTISFAVQFWSRGAMKAMFLRHEGFLGALGAFMSYEKHGLDDLMVHQLVERFPMGAPYTGGKIHGPPLGDLNEKISWMEKFVRRGTEITAPVPMAPPGTTGLGGFDVPSSRGDTLRSDASNLNVGVLHLVPTLEVFPLLANPKRYEPNTIDLADPSELEYWFTVLSEHLPDLVDKAVASEGGTDDAKRRGDAFARAFSAHLARLREEPAAYGKLGLANLLEMREECLREFNFFDAYRSIKQRENEASLAVLPDLLMELDSMPEETRLDTLIEGVLAANIFDWGSRACVDLYHKGTIIEIYRMSRKKMQRPWRVDDFDAFKERILGSGDKKPPKHKRALLFVDNSGADVVLGMLPLARELLRRGTEVVLVANSLPALNDVTAMELPEIVAEAAKHCDILRQPSNRIQSEGGVTEQWDEQEDQFQCVGVAPQRNILRPNSLSLPNFHPFPRLVYIERGQGVIGITIPGCAETYTTGSRQSSRGQQEEQQQEQWQGQRSGDRHQKVHRFRQGDIIAIPAGAAHWTFNDGNEDLVAVSINDLNNPANQLDLTSRSFYLAGGVSSQGQQREHQRQHQGQGSQNIQNIFSGFDTQLLAEAFNVPTEVVQKMQREDERGLIVQVREGMSIIRPDQQQWQEQGQWEGQRANALEETICSPKIRYNLDNQKEADIVSRQAGRLNIVNHQKLPILQMLDLSAEKGNLLPNALFTPHWSMRSHSIIYVTRGEAHVQIVSDNGQTVLDDRVNEGDMFVVPQFFAVTKKAGQNGFEWVSFKTNRSPMKSSLAGYTSVFRAMPLQVITNAYQVSPSQAQNLKLNRGSETFLLSPKQTSS